MSGTESTEPDMDELITQRREEKRKILKEKLHHKLGTIRDKRVAGVNHDPFPEGSFEQLRNNNIWENVLGFLSEPCDVSSAYFACGTFAEILEERRMLLLLPKVLNAFKRNVDNAFEGGVKDRKLGVEKRQTWRKICLDARGVSKCWKEIADFQLFDSDFSKPDWFLETDWMNAHKRDFAAKCVFENEESVDRASSLFDLTLSPTNIRSVRVKMDALISEPFSTKVIEFLRVHGRSVWFFDFQCSDWCGYKNPAEAYERLCDMLELLPNLKSLGLDFKINVWHMREVELEEAYEVYKRKFDQRPFPELLSLEHLRCYMLTDESLLSHILRKCINLKSVEQYPPCLITSTVVPVHLMALTLERYYGFSEIITFIMSHPTSWPTPWPLKHLTITPKSQGQPLSASQLFPVINNFRDTLQVLRILHDVEMDMDADAKNICLDLPHLKTLSIQWIYKGKMGFDELLNLKSLENISVACVLYEGPNAKVKVMEYLQSGGVKHTNVWKCFPNLKRLIQTFPITESFNRASLKLFS